MPAAGSVQFIDCRIVDAPGLGHGLRSGVTQHWSDRLAEVQARNFDTSDLDPALDFIPEPLDDGAFVRASGLLRRIEEAGFPMESLYIWDSGEGEVDLNCYDAARVYGVKVPARGDYTYREVGFTLGSRHARHYSCGEDEALSLMLRIV